MSDRIDPESCFGVALFGTPIASVAPQGAGVFESSYTEAGPEPGTPVPDDVLSRWRPRMQGAQSVAVTTTTIRPGFPGIDGARMLYRLATDTASRDYRGWSEPNLPVQWTAPASGWGASADFALPVGCALPNGRVAVIAPLSVALTGGRSWAYDPRTEQWTDGLDWSTTSGLGRPCALAYDAGTGRLIVWSGVGTAGDPATRAYSSVDEGATWTLYSRGMWPVTVAGSDVIRVATDPGGADWLGFVANNHIVSSDRGATWRLVTAAVAGAVGDRFIPIRTTAGWLAAYVRDDTELPCVRLLPSPSSPLAVAAETTVGSIEASDIVGCTDADGVVYLLTRGTATATTRHILTVYRSVDGGSTWDRYFWAPSVGDDARVLALQDLVSTCGQLHMVYTQGGGASGAVSGTVALVSFGGWSQLESGSGATFAGLGVVSRFSFGQYNGGSTHVGRFWLPYAAPEDSGWAHTASTGNTDFDTATPGMRVEATGATSETWSYAPAVASLGFVAGGAAFQLDPGSADLATIGTSDPAVFYQPALGDVGSTVRYNPVIDVGTDGIQVRDGATIRATATFDTTSNRVHIRWMLRPGAITVWYRVEDVDSPAVWHRAANDVVVTSTGATNTAGLTWGGAVDSDADFIAFYTGTAAGGEWLSGIDTGADVSLTSANGVRGMRWGRPVPGAGAGGYPVPEATAADEDLGRVAATGGPAKINDVVELPVAYAFGVHHTDPTRSASPRTKWVADEDADQAIVFDLGDPVWHGGAVVLVALNATLTEVAVEFDNGAGAWSAAEVMSMALVGNFNYTLTGRVAVPRTGGDTLDRYVGEGELVGAWAMVSTGTTPVYRRVVANSGGYWAFGDAKQQLRVTFASPGEDGGIDGTEQAAGAGTLYHHSAIRVIYPGGDTARRYVRVSTPALTGGGVPSAGILTVARLVAIGADPDWTWTRTLEFSRTVSRAGDGTPSVRRRGPPREVWSYPWTGGIALGKMRLEASDADHVAASGGVPLGTAEDAWHTWFGVIEHALESGQVPCILIPALPSEDATITDPLGYVYGGLAAESIGVTSVVGEEGVDEVVRLDSPTVEQIK